MNRKVHILQSVQSLRVLAVIFAMLLAATTAWAEEITVNLGEGRGTATFNEASLVFSKCEALEVGYTFDIPLEVMTRSKTYAGVVMQNYTATLDNGETVDGTLTGEIVAGASHTYTYTVTGNEMTRQPVSVGTALTRSGDSDDVEIATWSGFRKGAASFTFDDGAPSHVNDAGPMFKKYGYKATFCLVVNWNPNWSGFQGLADEGHEIASHSNSHGNNMSGEEVSSKNNIKGKINQKYGVITVAYPNCNVPNESAVLQNYIVGRICNGSWKGLSDNMGKDGPSNWAQVPAIMTGSEGQVKSTNDFTSQMQKVVQSNGWVAFLTHGFQGKNNGSATYSPTDINAIDGALKWAQQNDKDIWVAPMGHVAMYIKERKASEVEVNASNDYSIAFTLTHSIADNVSEYDYPLSLRVRSDWNKVEVTQDGVKLESKIDGGYIYFDAVPNAGNILVKNANYNYGTITPSTDVTVSGTVAWTEKDDTKFYVDGTTVTLGYDGTVPSGYTVGYTVTKAGGGTVDVDETDGITSFAMPADNVSVSASVSPVSYVITYNLAGGTVATANPTTYTVESDAITLNNPTRTGFSFAGWTGTGLDAATMTVTIAKGSTNARSYTATWKKLLTNTDIKVSAIADQTYTGEALTPAVTVKDGETDITAQCDITYQNNTNVGTATVTIKAKAASTAYSSETSTTFEITEPPVLGDANGDNEVNVADIVKLVTDGASQSDIDAVVKIIMKQ